MGKTLYLECASGISGDMTVAALLDLGADETALREALASLPLVGYRVEVGRVLKSGIDACDFNVVLAPGLENHDHDMEYLYGPHGGDACGCSHVRGHGHGADHAHGSEHHDDHEGGADSGHAHRTLADVRSIIRAASLTPRAASCAERIFEILADAEAKAHGTTRDAVHFHEVGAVDSIVDIVAAAVCLDDLDITEVIVPALHEGTGTVRCAHGVVPVPVPAVAEIARAHSIPLSIMQVKGEFVTPTGAAIVAAVRTSGTLPVSFTCQAVGLGAGKREHELPGILRAMVIADASAGTAEGACRLPDNGDAVSVWKLETDIDDCSGEALGLVAEMLLDAGAREAHYAPIFMKKGRPAYQLQVLCPESLIAQMEEIIFVHTTTIGIRRMPMLATALPRECTQMKTRFGLVDVKRVVLPDGSRRDYPEYESIAKICRDQGVSYGEVYRAAMDAAPRR